VLLSGVLFYSCEKKDDSIIDPVYNSPTISGAYISKDTVFTNSVSPVIGFNTSVKVDLNGGDQVSSVTCKIYLTNGIVLDSIKLFDNGILPDSIGGDGRYSGTFNITNIQCLQVGIYQVQYFAQNRSGLFSNIISKNLPVVNGTNLAPVLSNPILPDSVVRPVSGSFDITLTMTVIDADGECDINSVFFDAYRPSGYHIGNVSIPMSRGINNTYTFTNPVLPAVPDSLYGYFKYVFRAYDNSNTFSNIITDSIKFVRP
jgi:hypothetical protein